MYSNTEAMFPNTDYKDVCVFDLKGNQTNGSEKIIINIVVTTFHL